MRPIALRYAKAGAVACAMLSCAGYFGRAHYLIELTCHFKSTYLILALAAAALFAGTKVWKWCALASAVVALNLVAVMPWYWGAPPVAEETHDSAIRIMVANVLEANTDADPFLAAVAQNAPDLIVVMEVNELWSRQLKKLHDRYPYHFTEPRQDSFGIALMSRIPLVDARVTYLATSGVPTIVAEIRRRGRDITLYAVHTLPPGSHEYAAIRNEHLQSLADLVRANDKPCIVAGDLNTTMWSPYYQEFERRSGLKNARRGFGLQPTWPTWPRWLQSVLTPFSIPLDHVLSTPHFQATSCSTLEQIGSDHLPLIVELSLTPPA